MSAKLTPIERERLLKLAQASGLKRKVAAMPGIARVERGGALPLSFAQQRLWFLCQMEGVSQAYHMPLGLHLQGELDRKALRRALDRTLARHEALRTTFALVDGEPVQKISSATDHRFHLLEHDLRPCGEAEKETQLARLMEEEASASFALQQGPLIRGRLIRLAEHQHALLITMHHIVSDGWSMGVLMNELRAHYDAFLRGGDDPLPPLPVQYADYAVWQRQWMEGEILQLQAAYWQAALARTPRLLELPTDHPRPVRQNFAGAFVGLTLDEELTAALRALGKKHGVTLYMILLAGWAALMGRLSGQTDLVIGSPVANRRRVEIENLIGFLVNILALRFDLSRSPSGSELIEQTKKQVLAAQQHQDIPFERVVELLQPARSLSHSPLCQVLFAWQNAVEGPIELPGLQLRFLPSSPHRVAKFDLTLFLKEEGDIIVGGVEYATSLFEAATIERYIGYFRTFLQGLVADPTQAVDRLAIVGKLEQQQLDDWNGTRVAFSCHQCVHELFEGQVETSPDKTAVVFEDKALSYRELNRRANQLAHYLRGLGVQPDSRVAICVDRGFEMIVGLLAVLKAGGAYVPLDPEYPVQRLRFMLEDSAPAVLLTQGHLEDRFSGMGDGVPVLDLNATAALQSFSESNPEADAVGLTSRHLAYVIYTSGSTGQPKGVMVEHCSVCNLVVQHVLDLWVNLDSRVLQFASFSSDVCGAGALMALCGGASLYFMGSSTALLMEGLSRTIERHAITHVLLPMAAMNGLPDQSGLTSLGTLVVGGERLSGAAAKRWARGRRLINAYGPTEATVCATLHTCHLEESGNPPIGRPIANTRIYILDSNREPVPIGVGGELYIGGAGVARGYWKRPELTAERFVADRFAREAGARMYRTGDLGRWLADGTIEFLGRNDFQVKIRGFRIELGEIEARLAEHPEVREAVVLAREDTAGEKRLVAYYTCRESRGGVSESSVESVGAEQLRAHLSAVVPDYMVPAAYVRMERLPLTPNGKLDRKALPVPEQEAYAVRRYEAPVGEMETKLAEVWAEVLKLEKVGRHDNFFHLGGHSLLAVRVVSRLRGTLSVEAGILDLFSHPVLADLAQKIKSVTQAKAFPIPRARRKELPALNASGIITATRSDGHKIASEDNGRTWHDLRTGKAVQ